MLYVVISTHAYTVNHFCVCVGPDPNDVFTLLEPASHQWNAIARELRVQDKYRDEFKRDVSLDNDERLENIIRKWLETECSPPTWDNLIEALERMKRRDIIRSIKAFQANNDTVKRMLFDLLANACMK